MVNASIGDMVSSKCWKRSFLKVTNENLTTEDLTLDKVLEVEVKKIIADRLKRGHSVARFDVKTRKVYREYPDGRKKYM